MAVKRFCLECGKEALASDIVCTECGISLKPKEQGNYQRTIQVPHSPITRKNKFKIAIVVMLVVLFAGFYKFGNSYTSAESTLKRFHQAAMEQDVKALRKLAEFEGGIQLSKGELEAIINYAKLSLNDFTKSIGQPEDEFEDYLYTLHQSGKVFGLFDGHKVIVQPQYVSAPLPVKELVYKLNEEKLKVTVDDGQAIIGPIAPGIYELKAEYKGEFMEFSQSEEVEALERYGDQVYANMEMEMSYVDFELYAPYENGLAKSSLVIGEAELAFNEGGFIESVGPLLLDGSIRGKVATEFPWGTIESDEFEVGSSTMYLENSGLNPKVEERIAETILAYGEEYIVAHAAADTKEMKTITNEWQEELRDYFDYGRVHGVLYSGQLNEVQVYFEEAAMRSEAGQFRYFIPVTFLTEEEKIVYGQVTLVDEIKTCSMELIYLKNDWKVNGCEGHWTTEVGGTILEGSKKFVKANGDVDAD